MTRNQLIEKHSKIWLALYNQREKDEVVNIGRKFDLVSLEFFLFFVFEKRIKSIKKQLINFQGSCTEYI